MTTHPLPPAERYASATAFEVAVMDRLRQVARERRHSLTELRRQFAYERFLARVFVTDDTGWVLKGATSLLARFGDARHTLDVDLYRDDVSATAALAELRHLVEHDLRDWFRFDVGPPAQVVLGVTGLRVPVHAWVGTRLFAEFKVDVVVAARVTGTPEVLAVAPLVRLPGLHPPPYRLYPIADHVADKVCGITERTGADRPSTRYRDLVDLVLIAQRARPRCSELRAALRSEFARRGLVPLPTFAVPATGWRSGYAAAARTAGLSGELASLDAAVAYVRALVEPALGDALPDDATWSPRGWTAG